MTPGCKPQAVAQVLGHGMSTVIFDVLTGPNNIGEQNGDTRSPHRGHCILFRAVVSALPAAFPFGRCVAILPQSRKGGIPHVARQAPSTQKAEARMLPKIDSFFNHPLEKKVEFSTIGISRGSQFGLIDTIPCSVFDLPCANAGPVPEAPRSERSSCPGI